MNIAISVLGFLLVIAILTTVHEYGHFWMARKFRIKVLRFSIGFGKTIFSWYDKLGTEYAISSIPLGGYVKMLNEEEGPIAANERHMAFDHKPVWQRMLVICAGPAFNIIFAVFAYWLMFCIGISSIVPVLGTVPKGTIADSAGLRRGSIIMQVNNSDVRTWEDITVAIMPHIGENSLINLKVVNKDTNVEKKHTLDLSNWQVTGNDGNILSGLGLEPYDPVLPIVGKVMPGYPAEIANLHSGDLILKADSKEMLTRSDLTNYIRGLSGKEVILTIKRDGEIFTQIIKPARKLIDGGEEVGFIGIQYQNKPWPKELIRTYRFGIFESLTKALARTKDYTLLTLQVLKKMVTGKISFTNIAGPISIAKYAGVTVSSGVEYFLGFLGLVSISLGVLNMLPIPVLDGGHFIYCLCELSMGRPLSEKTRQLGYYAGFVVLGVIMIFAVYNDLMRF